MFIKSFFLAITVSVFGTVSAAQQPIMITLRAQNGHGPFNPGSVLTSPLAADKPRVSSIPAGIKEYVVRSIDFQGYNKVYKTYIEQYGLTKAQTLEGLIGYDYDTAMLTTKDYRHLFNVVVGTNQNNKWVVVVDVNNNTEYTDDPVYIFDKLETSELRFTAQQKLPGVVLPFEFFDGKAVRKLPTRVLLNPYPGNLIVAFPDSIENKYFLSVTIPQHKKGTFNLRGKQYDFYLYNYSLGLSYTRTNTRLMVSPSGRKCLKEADGNETFRIDDTLTIDHHQYTFESASMFGDAVTLKHVGYTKRPTGSSEQYFVPAVEANTVDGVPFALASLRGKYVLLDFWGTWCLPCIEAMPGLAALHGKYKGQNLAVISIADDQDLDKVKQFNERLQMNWINLFQPKGGGNAERNFINRFKITAFPTLILIDPNGKIISRGKPIAEVDAILEQAFANNNNSIDNNSPR